MADVASWGQNYLSNIQAPLLIAQDLKDAKQRNALIDQRMMQSREEQNYLTESRNALRGGDPSQIAQYDPRAAAMVQEMADIEGLKAWEQGGTVARQIKASAAPAALARQWFGSDESQKLIQSMGLDPSMIDIDDATDESVIQFADFIEQESARRMGLGAGADARIQSRFTDEQGNVNALVDRGGVPEVVPLGYKERNPLQVMNTDAGVIGVDRNTGGSSTIVSQDELAAGAADTAARTKGATSAEERRQGYIQEGVTAADTMPVLARTRELLNGIETGGIDAANLKAKSLLGVTGADEAELTLNMGKAVLSQLRSTFGAQFTEREGQILLDMEANLGKSTQGNKRIIEQAYKLAERKAQRGLKAAEDAGDYESADIIRESMNFDLSPEPETTSGIKVGRFTVEEEK